MYSGRRVTQVIDYDVWNDEEGRDHWDIEQNQDIDEAIEDFKREERADRQDVLSSAESHILDKFAQYLKNR